MNKAREYIATLCHMKDSGLMPYDSERPPPDHGLLGSALQISLVR
jgi:hypothetical protein